MARGLVHDVDVWRVEAEGRSWETIGDQVHPEQLYGNESLRETKGSCQEDAVRCSECTHISSSYKNVHMYHVHSSTFFTEEQIKLDPMYKYAHYM